MPLTLRASALLLAAVAFPGGDLAAQCLAADSPEAIEMRDSWRAMLVLGEAPAMWRRLDLTAAQKDSITLTDEPALCERVAKAIAEFRGVAVGEFTFALMRAGSGHLAQSSDLRIDGMQTTYEFDDDTTLVVGDRWLPPSPGPRAAPTASRCFEADNGHSMALDRRIRWTLSDPRREQIRRSIGMQGESADSVRHVADEATCARAIAAIKAHLDGRYEQIEMALFRAGRFHWAETQYPRSGGWSMEFILDSAAGRVVRQF